MPDNFFVQSWYRVAGLRPRIASHVTVGRHRYGSQSWYAVSDPVSGRVHRLTPPAYTIGPKFSPVYIPGRRSCEVRWACP